MTDHYPLRTLPLFGYSADQSAATTLLQQRIKELLSQHVGADQAITAARIAKRLNETDRAVRLAIAELRKSGELICSSVGSPPGYFYAANMDEVRTFLNTNYKSRAYDILVTGSRMATAAQRHFGGQLSFPSPEVLA